MACSEFNPNLPTDTAEQQAQYEIQLLVNIAEGCNATCDSSCTDLVSAEGIATCSACLANVDLTACASTACTDCLNNATTFQDTENCVEESGLTTRYIVGIVVGAVAYFILNVVGTVYYAKLETEKKNVTGSLKGWALASVILGWFFVPILNISSPIIYATN